jgi:hypothetical protein
VFELGQSANAFGSNTGAPGLKPNNNWMGNLLFRDPLNQNRPELRSSEFFRFTGFNSRF